MIAESMRYSGYLGLALSSVALTACGSNEPAPVVEQIVIRAPGKPAANATMEQMQAQQGDAKVDLVALGEEAFATCSGCHNADPGGPNMSGPNLHGVVGREAGAVEDYPYSEALAGSGITWDRASLDRFLANPSGYVPGTGMVAGAVRDGETRAAIVAYLASTSE